MEGAGPLLAHQGVAEEAVGLCCQGVVAVAAGLWPLVVGVEGVDPWPCPLAEGVVAEVVLYPLKRLNAVTRAILQTCKIGSCVTAHLLDATAWASANAAKETLVRMCR